MPSSASPAGRDDIAAPTLSSLFDYADFGPWVRQLITTPDLPFDRPDSPLDSELDQIEAQRLAAWMLLLAKNDRVELTREQAHRLRHADFGGSRLSMQARHAGARAAAELSNGGIRTLVIKGPAIAGAYRVPRLRAFADLDLLVAPRDFRRSLRLLLATGWRVKETYPRAYFPRWCVEGTNLERGADERVDLHHHAPPWAWGRGLAFAGMWHRSRLMDLAGEAVRCASAEDNLLIAAMHTVSDRSRPGKTAVIWRDLIELSRAVEPNRAIDLARSTGLSGWLGQVLASLPAGTVAPGLAAALAVDEPTQPRRLATLLDVAHTGRRPAREWGARLPTIPRFAYAAGVAVPSRRYLRETQSNASYRSYWWSLLRPSP